ncbi:BLUF domain-containing protein [Sphingomonas alpina]|uniref:BLUF domain-containing protein n=1 Tax=Sphingomonas alpina TaxID=653931 RepID=A0A7H0LN70_9SPHN|nr:BLUF domain-containing protein [Sphingomonas alpina]QNQ11123.1 BLUF domain-containing protein [Sphingomonas alpina]
MRQILYVSISTVPGDKADLVGILEQSRHNNAIDGVTGLLWSDGRHFMQVIEGPEVSIKETFARIHVDTRHHQLEVLHDRPIENREFGGWSMAHRRATDPVDAYDAQMRRLLSRASPFVSRHFFDLMNTGAADR